MGARTDAARAQVVAARADLAEEVIRLEAAGRSAVDVPARIRRAPAKTAGLAAGAAFLIAGGPGRLFRRVKRAVVGPQQELPKSMLPKEVDQALRKLGPDGDKVRGTLEREFAKYLDEPYRRRPLSARLRDAPRARSPLARWPIRATARSAAPCCVARTSPY